MYARVNHFSLINCTVSVVNLSLPLMPVARLLLLTGSFSSVDSVTHPLCTHVIWTPTVISYDDGMKVQDNVFGSHSMRTVTIKDNLKKSLSAVVCNTVYSGIILRYCGVFAWNSVGVSTVISCRHHANIVMHSVKLPSH